MRKINIFENRYCQPSAAEPLVGRLREHYDGQAEINVYDLSKPEGLVPLPPSLFLKMESGDLSCLPAMTVDAVVVTTGWLPSEADVVAVVEAAQPVPRPAQQAGASCCGPQGGCC